MRLARLLLALLALLDVASVQAQSGLVAPTLEAVISPPYYGSTDGEFFGSALELDGDYAAVSGAHYGPYGQAGSGEVHVLRRVGTGWALSQTLVPPSEERVLFGAAIALRDSLLFVGSPLVGRFPGNGVGAVYIYALRGDSWVQADTLRPPPPSTVPGEFGQSIDFDGQRLLVGAPTRAGGAGAAYVFERADGDWTRTATLTAPLPTTSRGFGRTVALDGPVAVIGEDLPSNVSLFELQGAQWTRTAVLQPLNTPPYAFGHDLSVSGDRVLVGAPQVNTNRGAAYVFERSGATWAQSAVLTDNAGGIDPPARFGAGVELDGDRALVGSPRLQRALMFTFDGTTWTRSAVFGVEETPQLRFGDAGETVALDGDRALLGAPWAHVEGTNDAGAVHAFQLGPTGWALTADVTLGPGRSGHRFGADVALSGDRVAVCAEGIYYVWASSTPSVYVFSVAGGVPTMETRIAVACGAVALGPDQLFVGSPASTTGLRLVRVYTRGPSGWAPSQTLSGSWYGAFGSAMSLDGDRLLVGAPGIGTARGHAYFYERTGGSWRLAQTLQAGVPEDSVSFGTSVTLDGARAVVGAPRSSVGGPSVGLAYVYERDGATWERVAVLTSPSPENDGLFGTSVALSGGRALVGARSEPDGDGGGATVFDGLAWAPTASLAGPGPGSSFGSAVALDGGRSLVGARVDGDSLGAAFLYGFDGAAWTLTAALASPDPADGEEYGASVAVEGRRFAVGAPYPVRFGPEFGAVYLYRDQVTVADEAPPVAGSSRLLGPRPNPASGTSRLVLTLARPETVTATVYDALGRSVQTVLDGASVVGEVALTVDARALAPGLYVVRVVGETFAESARLVVAR